MAIAKNGELQPIKATYNIVNKVADSREINVSTKKDSFLNCYNAY